MIGPNQVARAAERFGARAAQAGDEHRARQQRGLAWSSSPHAFVAFAVARPVRRPSPIRAVVDGRARHPLLTASDSATDAMPAGIASLMTGLLENVVRYGVAQPVAIGLRLRPSGRGEDSGTTDDFKDAWFVGFTPDVVAGVWVG